MRLRRPNIFISSCIVFAFLGINPSACSKACNGGDDAARGCGKSCTHEEGCGRGCAEGCEGCKGCDGCGEGCGKGCGEGCGESCGHGCSCKQGSSKRETHILDNTGGRYFYNKKSYVDFSDIPFSKKDNIYLEGELTADKVQHLMKKKVRFVYNERWIFDQMNRDFEVIILMPDDAGALQRFYEVDAAGAEKLGQLSDQIKTNDKVKKVSSFEEMMQEQEMVLSQNRVPVLVFHNSSQVPADQIRAGTNIITCNSYGFNQTGSMISTARLDIQGVINGINELSGDEVLEGFYNKFTDAYYEHEKKQRNKRVLIVAGTATVGGAAIIYYYQS